MAGVAALVVRLEEGGIVWPWQWPGLLAEIDEPLVACLVTCAGRRGHPYGRQCALKTLRRLARNERTRPMLLTPENAVALCVQLAAELPADEPAGDGDAWRLVNFELFAWLLEQYGATAADAARGLLDGPPRLARVLTDNNGVSRLCGAKLAALELLGRHLGPQDLVRVSRLAEDAAEPLAVRLQAALAWLRLAGEQAAAAVAAVCLSVVLGDTATSAWRHELRDRGAPLVPHLIEALHAGDVSVRLRAKELLAEIGAPAVEALTTVVRSSDAWNVLNNAEEALAAIDRRALHQAQAAREADGRSLSLARPNAADGAQRGLSRSDKQG